MDDYMIVHVKEEIENPMMGRPHVVILGAGASVAGFLNGDRNGNKLPVMLNLIETLKLGPTLDQYGIDYDGKNFEVVYGDLYEDKKYNDLLNFIEDQVKLYFARLDLPDFPTIYDHLVLSLRPKDIIATFNWDPFLFKACVRNYKKSSLPHVVYLHGNVMIGYCLKNMRKGMIGTQCSQCKEPFTPSRLLFPIKQKNYTDDMYISGEWDTLREYLKNAYVLTIFGYGAPDSDVEAVRLMKDAWGNIYNRNLEEIEIINTEKEEVLTATWNDFIHTHHYQIATNFYDSWMARHPRRTCEAMWNQLMEARFVSDNKIPKDFGFNDLWKWYEPLLEAEKQSDTAK